jgi:hypothetical protein
MVQYGQSAHEKQLRLLYRRREVNIEYGAFSNTDSKAAIRGVAGWILDFASSGPPPVKLRTCHRNP